MLVYFGQSKINALSERNRLTRFRPKKDRHDARQAAHDQSMSTTTETAPSANRYRREDLTFYVRNLDGQLIKLR